MSYAGYTEYRREQAQKVPFANYTAAMSHIAEAIHHAFGSITRYIAKEIEAHRAEVAARSTRGALSGLNDRALKDIGIHRSQIFSVSRHVAQDPSFDHRKSYQ